jgi:hypothetical protein
MSTRLIIAALLFLAACGHQTALVRPSEIPAYEKARQEKREKYEPYREAE